MFAKYTSTSLSYIYPGASRAGVYATPYDSPLSRNRCRNALAMRLYLHHLANPRMKMYLATFTYTEDMIPSFRLSDGFTQRGCIHSASKNSHSDVVPCFNKRDWQLFMKRFRKYLSSKEPYAPFVRDVKFMAVGEFGPNPQKTMRSHIHVAIFLPDIMPFDEINKVFNNFWYLEGSTKSLGSVNFAESKFRPGQYDVQDWPGFCYAGKYARKGQVLKRHPHFVKVETEAPHLYQRYMNIARFFCISHGLGNEWYNIPGLDVDDVLLNGLQIQYRTKKAIVTKRVPLPSYCVHKYFFVDRYKYIYPSGVRVFSASYFWSQLSLTRDVFIPWQVKDRWVDYVLSGDFSSPFIVPRCVLCDDIAFVVQDDDMKDYIKTLRVVSKKSFLRPHLRIAYRKYLLDSISREAYLSQFDPLAQECGISKDNAEIIFILKRLGLVFFHRDFLRRVFPEDLTCLGYITQALWKLVDIHIDNLVIGSENWFEYKQLSLHFGEVDAGSMSTLLEQYSLAPYLSVLEKYIDISSYKSNENCKEVEKDYENTKRARSLYYKY